MPNKAIGRLTATLTLLCLLGAPASAGTPYPGYEYSTDNYNGLGAATVQNARSAPDAFVYDRTLTGGSMGLDDPLSAPEDVVCAGDNAYILDSQNGRIVVADLPSGRAVCVIEGWAEEGGAEDTRFTGGRGLYLRGSRLYACLTDSRLIVAVDLPAFVTDGESPRPGADGWAPAEGMEVLSDDMDKAPVIRLEAAAVIRAPDLSGIRDNLDFRPIKMVSDPAGRLYVVVSGVIDGLLMLDEQGAFSGFVGANPIKLNAFQRFWRRFMTEEQINKQEDTAPIEFYSLDIDDEGFVYTTAKGGADESLVRRINMRGDDVLKTGAAYVRGDLSPLVNKGEPGVGSTLIDIDVTGAGLYTCLDSTRGRLFTYSHEGDLLFVFGGLSAQRGAFLTPVAVQWYGEHILVLDKDAASLVVFRPTEYGQAVITAAAAQFEGGYGQSYDLWHRVIEINAFNQTAHRNVGKLEYDRGNYESAMAHFRLGDSQELYSRAFGKQREIAVRQAIPWILGVAIAIAALALGWTGFRALRRMSDRYRFFRQEAAKYRMRRRKAKGDE